MKGVQLTIHVDKPKTFIRNFFEDKTVSNQFIEIAKHLIGKDKNLIIRTDCAIIGLSRPGERYWCYAVLKDSGWEIKFKHCIDRIPLSDKTKQELRELCDECYSYYVKNASEFLIGVANCKNDSDEQHPPEDAMQEVEKTENLYDEDLDEIKNRLADLNKHVYVQECDNCMLRKSEKCSKLDNILCDDYQPLYHPSNEEIALWPTHGDATSTDEEHQTRYFEGKTT